jgi:hypothetical protein
MPVAVFRAVTAAPGTEAPEGSVTMPTITASEVCAEAHTGNERQTKRSDARYDWVMAFSIATRRVREIPLVGSMGILVVSRSFLR